MLCECLFLNRQWIRINITLVKYSMNELYAKRLDCIPAVMWVPQVQAKEAQRLAPAVHELNLVVSLIVTTLVMTRTWENNSARLFRVGGKSVPSWALYIRGKDGDRALSRRGCGCQY